MTGNLASNPENPQFLLDESLTPPVAKALNLVGYRFESVLDVFRYQGANDPDIIGWCRRHDAVWVHADDRAKKQHKVILSTSGIRTLWIYRTGGKMTAMQQLRILSYVLIPS